MNAVMHGKAASLRSRLLEKLRLWQFRTLVPLVVRWNWRGARATALSIRDESMDVNGGAIRVRVYTPQGAGPFPMLHFFHGGGWVFGDLDTHDPLCRDLCVKTRRIVVAFDYRLAPEHAFPVPAEDALASLTWMRQHAARLGGDPNAIVICGDSAGGNLAAVAAQQARTLHPGLIKGQVLIYPVTDHCAHAQWESYASYGGEGFGLSHVAMSQLWEMYLRNSTVWTHDMVRHDLATPLHVADLSGLPRSLFVIAEEDMLRDEAVDYARRLELAGIPVQVKRYAGQRHGFVGVEPSDAYKQAIADIAAWLDAA